MSTTSVEGEKGREEMRVREGRWFGGDVLFFVFFGEEVGRSRGRVEERRGDGRVVGGSMNE